MHIDTTKYKAWTWKHPAMLHWMINPGLVVNELLLGQKIPKLMLIEKDSKKSLAERTFIPCPHCHTLHSSLKWSLQNKTAFKNWFGLYCHHCGKIIPCLTNLTSYIVLGLTFPFWIGFRKRWKQQWLEVQKEKFSKPLNLAEPEYNWVTNGLGWGMFMYVSMEILFPLIEGTPFNYLKLGFGFVYWVLGGLGFGYIMKKLFIGKATKPTSSPTSQP